MGYEYTREPSAQARPATVLLPCSPNNGVFGNDGLYAESKLGVQTLVNKWKSEKWENYLSIVAAVIGWTRSGLITPITLITRITRITLITL